MKLTALETRLDAGGLAPFMVGLRLQSEAQTPLRLLAEYRALVRDSLTSLQGELGQHNVKALFQTSPQHRPGYAEWRKITVTGPSVKAYRHHLLQVEGGIEQFCDKSTWTLRITHVGDPQSVSRLAHELPNYAAEHSDVARKWQELRALRVPDHTPDQKQYLQSLRQRLISD